MKINLTYKEAHLVMAVLWDLVNEGGQVHRTLDLPWRLTDAGQDLGQAVIEKLEDATEKQVRKTGKQRDLAGSPTGTIQEAKWDR